jgi:hypothetical protein
MSLRNLLGLGRKLIKKKADDTVPEAIETTTIGGLPDLAKLKTPTPNIPSVASQSKALVAKEPQISAPLMLRPMDNMRPTAVSLGDDLKLNKIFGSSTYDRIAMKGDGSFTADQWADWLTDRGKRRFKIFGKDFEDGFITGRKFKYDTGKAKATPHLLNKEMTVPIEELFDANIAQFNKAGDLTGGILFAAKEAGVKIPGRVLSDMVQASPVNRLKIRELGIPQTVINKAENTVNTQIARLADMERSLQRTVNVNPAATRVEKIEELRAQGLEVGEMKNTLKTLREEMRVLNSAVRDGNASAVEDTSAEIAVLFNKIKKGLPSDKKIAINKMQGEIDDIVASTRNITPPKFQGQSGYTYPGGQNYREAVIVLDESIPKNIKGGRRENPHFKGKQYDNPLAHIRWDTRTTTDGKKAFLIHEVQSDTNQGISKFLRDQKADPFNTSLRQNPYQNEKILKFLFDSRKKLSDEVLGGKLSAARMELNAKKIKDLDEVIKSTVKSPNARYSDTDGAVSTYDGLPTGVDYIPLLDRASQAKASLAYLTNLAAREGVDYVAIAPVNLMMRGISRKGPRNKPNTKAYQEAYGYFRGNKTPGSKSPAVIPALMKKIGKDFDTKAGTIKISKSDPTKPYKRVETDELDIMDGNTYKVETHASASSNPTGGSTLIPDNDLRLYTDVFSVKVSPNMVNPQKIYKKEGGFISKYN